jgi:hypothetical protein
MRAASPSTLAQLLFSTPPCISFSDVVDELETVLSRYPATTRALSREGEDVAIFDLDGSRVVLGFADRLEGQHAACITVSVGTGPDDAAAPGPLADRRTSLCRKIADRLSSRYPYDAVVWHETLSPVTPDLIDRMIDTLPAGDMPNRLAQKSAPEIDPILTRISAELDIRQVARVPDVSLVEAQGFAPLSVRPPRARLQLPPIPRPVPVAAAAPAPAAPAEIVANDRPLLPQPQDVDAARIRAALYPPEDEAVDDRPSTQMRLAIHAMNATMIVALLPVGAAVMTYSILRGEDLRLSGRMLAITGLFLAASQSQMGQQVMSLI